ncbi:MAG: phospholipase effector Tle1 domain-containing protein [Kiritimatiellia bacterium]
MKRLTQLTQMAHALLALALITTRSLAAPPAWWTTRGVLATNAASTNDYAVANLGQLKWFATNALTEFDAQLSTEGGAGAPLRSRVASLCAATGSDYRAINLGMLKNTAAPFYDRLGSNYPWSGFSTNDYAVANLGQLKWAFDLNVLNSTIQQFSLNLSASGVPATFNLPAVSWYPGNSQPVVSIQAAPSFFYDYFVDWKDTDSGAAFYANPLTVIMNTNRHFMAEMKSLLQPSIYSQTMCSYYFSFDKDCGGNGSKIPNEFTDSDRIGWKGYGYATWTNAGKIAGGLSRPVRAQTNWLVNIPYGGRYANNWWSWNPSTVCAWVRHNGFELDTTIQQTIFDFPVQINNPATRAFSTEWRLFLNQNFRLYISPVDSTNKNITAYPGIPPNEWHHIVLTDENFFGSQSFYNLYVDGVLRLTNVVASNSQRGSANVGQMIVGGDTTTPYLKYPVWNGQIDEVMVFGCLLGPDQIQQLYKLSAPNHLNIVTYNNYSPFSENATTMIDISTNGTPIRSVCAFNGQLVAVPENARVVLSVPFDYIYSGNIERVVCRGYTGSGQVSNGNTNVITLANFLQPSTVTWLWQTHYWANFIASGGCGHISANSGWYPKGTNLANITAVPDPGANFIRWSTGIEGACQYVNPLAVIVSSPITVTALFSTTQGWLIVDSLYGSPNPGRGTNNVNYGMNAASVATDTRDTTQYVCIGWAGSGSVPVSGITNCATFSVATNPSAIIWQWATNYLVKSSVTPSGGGSISNNFGWYRLGATATVTAVQTSSSLFRSWTGTGITLAGVSNNNPLTFVVTNPVSLTANFDTSGPLTVQTVYGTPAPESSVVNYGTPVSASISSPIVSGGTTQYVSLGWTGGTGSVPASGESNTFDFTFSRPSSINWSKWATNYLISAKVRYYASDPNPTLQDGGGIVSNNNGEVSASAGWWYGRGTNIVLTAIPADHCIFLCWTGSHFNLSTNPSIPLFTVTNPVSRTAVFALDSDGDGIPDWWENRYGLNPFDASDANEMLNFNGTNNRTAYQQYGANYHVSSLPTNTPPPSKDSDGDGIPNYYEGFFFGTGSFARDSDNDGLTDGDELFIYGTNPLLVDTDTGGVPDGWEVANGLNPLKAADDTSPCPLVLFTMCGTTIAVSATSCSLTSSGYVCYVSGTATVLTSTTSVVSTLWSYLSAYRSSFDTDGDGLVDCPSVATHVVPVVEYRSFWLPASYSFAFADPTRSGFCQNEASSTNTARVDSNGDGFSDAMEIFAGRNAVSSNSCTTFTNNYAVLAISIARPGSGKWGMHMRTPGNVVFAAAADAAANGFGYACVPREAVPASIGFSLAYTNSDQLGSTYAVDFRLATGGGPFDWVIDPAVSAPVSGYYPASSNDLVSWGFVKPRFIMSAARSFVKWADTNMLPITISLQPSNAPFGSLTLHVATNFGGGEIAIFTNLTSSTPISVPVTWTNNIPASIWVKGKTWSASNDDVAIVGVYSNALLSPQLTNRLTLTVADASILWAHKYAVANSTNEDGTAQIQFHLAPATVSNAVSVQLKHPDGNTEWAYSASLTGRVYTLAATNIPCDFYSVTLNWGGIETISSNNIAFVSAGIELVTENLSPTGLIITATSGPPAHVTRYTRTYPPGVTNTIDELTSINLQRQEKVVFSNALDARNFTFSTVYYTNSVFLLEPTPERLAKVAYDSASTTITKQKDCRELFPTCTVRAVLSPAQIKGTGTVEFIVRNISSNMVVATATPVWTVPASMASTTFSNVLANTNLNFISVKWTLPRDPMRQVCAISNQTPLLQPFPADTKDAYAESNKETTLLGDFTPSNVTWSVAGAYGTFGTSSTPATNMPYRWTFTNDCVTSATVAVSWLLNGIPCSTQVSVKIANEPLTLTPPLIFTPAYSPDVFLAFPHAMPEGFNTMISITPEINDEFWGYYYGWDARWESMYDENWDISGRWTYTNTGLIVNVWAPMSLPYTVASCSSSWLTRTPSGCSTVYVCNVSQTVDSISPADMAMPGAIVFRSLSTSDCSRLVPMTLDLQPVTVPYGSVTLTLSGAATNYLVWTNSAKRGTPFNSSTNWPATQPLPRLFIEGVTTSSVPRDLAWILAYRTNLSVGVPVVTNLLRTTVVDAQINAYGPDKKSMLTNDQKRRPGIFLSRNAVDANRDGQRDDWDVRFNGPADSNGMAVVIFRQIPGITNFVGFSNVFVTVSGPVRLFRLNVTNNELCLLSGSDDDIPSFRNIASQISTGDVRMLVEGIAPGTATITLNLGSVAGDSVNVTILPVPSDSDADGLCQHAGGSLTTPEVTIMDPLTLLSSTSVQLGCGSLPCGLTAAAYLTAWHVPASDPTFLRQNVCNLDTRVLPTTGDGLFRVLRPNGRVVCFDTTNGLPQMPDIGRTYRLITAGDNYVLVFASGYKHYFDRASGSLLKIEDPNGTSFATNHINWPKITTRNAASYATQVSSPNYGTNGALSCTISYDVSNQLASVVSDYTAVTFTNLSNTYTIKTTAGADSHITSLTPAAKPTTISRNGLLTESWGVSSDGKVVSCFRNGTAQTDYSLASDLLGDRVIRVTSYGAYSGGTAEIATSCLTQTNSAAPGLGQVQWIIAPGGGFTYLAYDASNRVTNTLCSIGSNCLDRTRDDAAIAAPPAPNPATCRLTTFDYTPQVGDLNNPVDYNRPRTISTYYQGTQVGKKFHVYAGNIRETRAATNVAAIFADAGNLKTRVTFDSGFPGFVQSVVDPCGTTTTFTNTANGAGMKVVSSVAGDPVGEGTITWRDSHGWVLRTDRVAGGTSVGMLATNTFDSLGNLLTTAYPDGRSDLFRYSPWGACILSSNREGVVSTFIQDALLRTTNAVVNGVTTRYADFDPFGNAGTIITFGKGTETQTVTRVYDNAGRLLSETAPFTGTTTYDTILDVREGPGSASGNLFVTTRGDHSVTNETYRDGTSAGVYGSATHPVAYQTGITSGKLSTATTQFPTIWTTNALVTPLSAAIRRTVTSTVDFAGRPDASRNADATAVAFITDRNGRTTCHKDECGNLNFLEYDVAGRLCRTYTDMNSNKVCDAGDKWTRWVYAYTTFRSQPVFRTDVYHADIGSNELFVGSVLARTDGKGTWTIDPFGKTTCADTAYTGAERKTTIALPDGTVAETISVSNLVKSVKGATDQAPTTIQKDGFLRTSVVTDPRKGTTATTYAPGTPTATNRIMVSSPDGTTTTVRDQHHQLVQVTLPDGVTEKREYYATGEPQRVSGGHDLPRTFVWLATGEQTALSTFRNFSAAPPSGGFDGVSDTTRWEYNLQRGWPEAKVYSDGTRHTFGHAPNGWLMSYRSARLITATYRRDAAGQLCTKLFSDDTPGVTNIWNQRDLVIAVKDPAGLRTNVFDAGSRLISTVVSGPASHALTIAYATNSDDRASATLALGVSNALITTYAFGTNGLLSSITAQCPALGATNLTFTYAWLTNATLLATIAFPNGVTNEFLYQTNADRVAALRFWPRFITPPSGSAAAPALEYDYLYDAAGRCTNYSRPYESRRDLYAYDTAGRLVQTKRQTLGSWSTAQWLYDTAGNRVAETNAITGISTNRLYNGLNQIRSCGYDADGNMTFLPSTSGGGGGGEGWSFQWDAENRLKIATSNGLLIATYQYDSQNRRISKTVGTTTYRYIYDGWNLVAEVRSQGSAVSTNVYVWGADHTGSLDTDSGGVRALLAIISGTTVYYPVMNNHGDVMALFDSTGTNIVARYERDPFGVLLSATGPAADVCQFGFQSKYQDAESGLVYFGHRYYAPTLGIFISRDPLEEEGGVNLYGYGKGSPLAIDPTGLAAYFFDGTGNDIALFDEKGNPLKGTDPTSAPSHIAALYWMCKDPNAFYENGVGTRTDKALGNMSGKGAKERLDDMFRSFERTYQNGKNDTDISIFGFSRGAAMAREFSNMIHDKYPNAKIRFLGLFDTVAQIGVTDDSNNNPGVRLNIPANVQYVAHAVAQDEKRPLFPLTSIVASYGGYQLGFGAYNGLIPGLRPRKYNSSEYKELKGNNYLEKPFAGAHSDIGGGYADGTNMDALRWMYKVARANGVNVECHTKEYLARRRVYKDAVQYHDSRWSVDKIPFTEIGTYTRRIYSGNLPLP